MASLPAYAPDQKTETKPAKRKSAEDTAKEQRRLEDGVASILMDLDRMVTDSIQKRKTTEERWLEDIRQFHGIYDSKVATVLSDKAEDARSAIFINITRPKTNAWAARLGDMLFPNDEKNWGIDPTPVPDLTRSSKEAAAEAEAFEREAMGLVEQNNEQVAEGGEADPELGMKAEAAAQQATLYRDKEQEFQSELAEARKRSELMAREIDDQLTESHYPARSRDVIDDMVKLGVGILKGPIVRDTGRRSWTQGKDGFELANDNRPTPTWRRVNPWHFFPDPSAETIDQAEYTFERHLPNRKMLRKMARQLNFTPEAVRRLLKDGPQREGRVSGNADLGFLAHLRGLEGGQSAENLESLDDRYIVWEFYGTLEIEQVATMIRAMGRSDDADKFEEDADPMQEMTVRIFFCDDTLLKIEEDYLLDSGESLYSVGVFEKAEASILGAVGVPRLMRNEQAMLNSAVRMMMDNAALAVGPQIVVDKERIQPENGYWTLKPRKVWQWIKNAGQPDNKSPPFDTFDIPMNQALLAAIVEMAMRFVDEAVSMPLIAQGEQGEHVTRTAHGMSMLFNSANVIFRRVVKNWDDDITAPSIRRAYDFNMQFSDKDEIKGDMKVEARGTSVLLVREMQAEQLLNIIAQYSTHPILGVALKAYECMRLVLQALSINPADVLLDREDYLEKVKTMEAAAAEGDSDPEAMKAQTQLQIAQLEHDSRIQVAGLNHQAAQMNMAVKYNLTMQQIQAMFETKKIDAATRLETQKISEGSKERALAAEIALERENANDARAQGLEPTGSGGVISMGGEKVN